MSYTLEQLADDIRSTLRSDDGQGGRERVCEHVTRALLDDAFVATHLQSRADGAHPREVLYEDDELGFCICGHVYDGAAIGEPHDHGSSWAIYGQADGETEMTEWRIVDHGGAGGAARVEPVDTYTMRRGDVRLYDVGAVHSPHREKPVKLLRIEGSNLDRVRRSDIVKL